MNNGFPPPGWYLRPDAWSYLTPTFPWNRAVSTASLPISPFQPRLPTFSRLPSLPEYSGPLLPHSEGPQEARSFMPSGWPVSGADFTIKAVAGVDDDFNDGARSSPTLKQGWSEEDGQDFGYGTNGGSPEDLDGVDRHAPYAAQPDPYHADGLGSIFRTPPTASSWLAAPTEQQSRAPSDQMNAPAFSDAQLPPAPIQLAGMASPIPGLRPPIPPWLIPGTPEWTEHFIRGLLGLRNAIKRSRKATGAGRDSGDDCWERFQKEVDKCDERKDDYAHPNFLNGCKERAQERRTKCIQNNGRPDPKEPLEWGPSDEEIWFDVNR
jgi:hypothetical protein